MKKSKPLFILLLILIAMSYIQCQDTEKNSAINYCETVNPDYVPHYIHVKPALNYPKQVYYLNTDQYPANLSKLDRLQHLYFSNKVDSALLAELNKSQACLRRMSMFDCKVDQLDFNGANMDSLKYFNITFSEFKDIQSVVQNISRLKALESLFFVECGIQEFPKEWLKLQHLKEVGIGTMNPADFNYEQACQRVSHLKQLRELSFSSAGITKLPDTFQSLKHLKSVLFYNCPKLHIQHVVSQLQDWKNLEEFSMAKNIEELPKEFLKLKTLKKIDLANNLKLNIPQALSILCQLENIEELDLSYCIEQVPEEETIGFFDDLVKMKKLKKLSLSHSTQLNGEYCWGVFEQLSSLEDLNLTYCYGAIGTGIHKLSNLKKLNISRSGVSKLEHIDKFPSSLESLEFKASHLEEFPKEIINTPSLVSVNLMDNKIMEVPEDVSRLKNLVHLDISYNEVAVLPESIRELSGTLRYLNLIGSPVGRNPIEVAKIRKWLPYTEVFEGR